MNVFLVSFVFHNHVLLKCQPQATSSRKWMGSFRNSWLLAFCAWSALGLIFCANLMLLISWMVTGVEGQTPTDVEEHPLLK